MAAYFIVFLVLLLFSTSTVAGSLKQVRQLLFFLMSIVLIGIAGCREIGVGADDYTYAYYYGLVDYYADFSRYIYIYEISDFNMEHGFVILMSLVSMLSKDASFFFLLIACLSVGFTSYTIYKFNSFVFLGLLVYFSNMYFQKDLNQIRIGLASSLIFYSFYLIYSKRLMSSFATILLASALHFSVILAYFGYLFNRVYVQSWVVISILVCSITVSFYGVGYFLLGVLPQGNFIISKIRFYIDSDLHGNKISTFDLVNIKNIILVLFFVYFRKLYSDRFPWFNLIFNTLLFMTVLRLCLSDFSILSARLASVFAFVDYLLIPLIIYAFRQKILGFLVVLVYASLTFYMTMSNPKWSALYNV